MHAITQQMNVKNILNVKSKTPPMKKKKPQRNKPLSHAPSSTWSGFRFEFRDIDKVSE